MTKKFFIVSYLLIFISPLFAQELDLLEAKDYLKQAHQNFEKKDYKKCREYALKAISVDSSNGEAYILICSAYISSAKSCFETMFEEDMVYCLAVDKLKKAIEVDTTVKEHAERLIRIYSKYFPSKEITDCFVPIVEGQDYLVKCWINEHTTVRFSD